MIVKSISNEQISSKVVGLQNSYDGSVYNLPFDLSMIIETLCLCPYHSKAIQLKAYLSVSLGYEIWVNGELNEDAKKEFQSLFPAGFESTIQNLALDYETFGNAYLEVVKKGARDGFKGSAIYHVPAVSMRISKNGFRQDIGTDSYIDFARYEDAVDRGIYHIKAYHPSANIYGLPDWISCLNAILLDVNATEWNYRFFQNNCVPQWAIIIKGGQLTESVENEIRDFFKQGYKGTRNAHKTLLIASDGIEVSFQQLQSDGKDMSFEKLKELCRNEIVAAHGVPPRLLGIVTAGQLGGSSEIEWQLKQFKSGILRQRQNVYQSALKQFLPDGWEIYFTELDVTDIKDDAEFYKAMVTAGILTPNEARQEIGYEIKDDLDSLALARLLGGA